MDVMKSYDIKKITGAQIRAARALLRWSAYDLAAKSNLGVATIRRAEATDGPLQTTAANLAAVRRALRAEGVDFIFDAEGGAGVSLRKIHS
jgi:transcriptional regulator with XRE-family HTH domain